MCHYIHVFVYIRYRGWGTARRGRKAPGTGSRSDKEGRHAGRRPELAVYPWVSILLEEEEDHAGAALTLFFFNLSVYIYFDLFASFLLR